MISNCSMQPDYRVCNVSAVPLALPPSCHQTGERLSLQPPATRPDQRTLPSPVLANLQEKLSDVPGTNFDLGLRDVQSSPPAPADMCMRACFLERPRAFFPA